MLRWTSAVIFITAACCASPVLADAKKDRVIFEKIFSAWTSAFNQKNLANTCKIFSPHLIANYQGIPPLNYATICHNFDKIFKESRHYEYTYKINQIYRSGGLAAVRITWHLQISEQGKFISETQDEGLDVFQQDKKGHWKIVNYLGFAKK